MLVIKQQEVVNMLHELRMADAIVHPKKSHNINRAFNRVPEELVSEIIRTHILEIGWKGEDVKISTLQTRMLNSILYQGYRDLLADTLDKDDFKYLMNCYKVSKNLTKKIGVPRAQEMMIKHIIDDVKSGSLRLRNSEEVLKELHSTGFDKEIDKMGKEIATLTELIAQTIFAVIDNYPGISSEFEKGERGDKKDKYKAYYIKVDTPVDDSSYLFDEPVPTSLCDIAVFDWKGTVIEDSLNKSLSSKITVDIDYFKSIMDLMKLNPDTFRECARVGSGDCDDDKLDARVSQIKHQFSTMFKALSDFNDSSFYPMMSVDFRGRQYVISPLSPTSGKCGRAVLRPGKAEKIGPNGYDAMVSTLAGDYGFDKLAEHKRVAEGSKLVEGAIRIGRLLLVDPVAGFKALLKSKPDDLWAAGATSIEFWRLCQWNEAGNAVEDFVSDLSCRLDATCSGIQCQAALMGNAELAKLVNINREEGDSEDAEDLYREAAVIIKEQMDKRSKLSEVQKAFVSLPISKKRKLLKPIVMVDSYSGTDQTLSDKVASSAVGMVGVPQDKLREMGDMLVKEYHILLESNETFKAISDYKEFARKMADAYTKKGLFPKFTMPVQIDNFKAPSLFYKYVESVGRQMDVLVAGRKLRLSSYCSAEDLKAQRTTPQKPKKGKTKNAQSPNLIHTLDALLLHTINSKLGGNVLCIHDCFAVVPSRVKELQQAVRDSLIAIFADNPNIVGDLIEQVKAETGVQLTDTSAPDKGWLRPGVTNSKYSVC